MSKSLYEKILTVYSELSSEPNIFVDTIQLRNDGDGKGDYIAAWNHPTLKRPTDEELQAR